MFKFSSFPVGPFCSWLVLVIFILACKLTVAAGTISGLLFYANTFAVNEAIFLPNGFTNGLTVFLAWLNLDLGIEACFYNGMDAYGKAWLQFVFPFYLCSIIIVIMIISKYSGRISQSLGSNPIAALVTLLYLSNAKILRAIISVLSLITPTMYKWRGLLMQILTICMGSMFRYM